MQDKNNSCGFFVHNFMIYLNLTSSELLIYALLYSYTKSKEGLYFGSLDYIAARTGVSRKTVDRAINKLLSNGLIKRCELAGRTGIRADLSIPERLRKAERASRADEDTTAEKSEEGAVLPEQQKRRVVPGRFLFPDVNTGKIYDTEPRYKLLEVGKDKVVKMTLEQYDKLKSLIPDIELKRYIDRLASIHIERSGMSDYWRKSDYRILRDWINEDYRA